MLNPAGEETLAPPILLTETIKNAAIAIAAHSRRSGDDRFAIAKYAARRVSSPQRPRLSWMLENKLDLQYAT